MPVDTDVDGMLPQSLRETLESTHRAALATNTRPPRVLYTVPTGQNPTGARVGAACPLAMLSSVLVSSISPRLQIARLGLIAALCY